MGLMTKIRKHHVGLMQKTVEVLGNILKPVSQEQAMTLCDGAEGWTILEVVCHLRDCDEIFYERAVLILEQEFPVLAPYDRNRMAVERRYNEQNLKQVYADLVKSRQRFSDFFYNLSNEQWERAGQHPEESPFTVTEAAMQVSRHDLIHIDQITRILAGSTTRSEDWPKHSHA